MAKKKLHEFDVLETTEKGILADLWRQLVLKTGSLYKLPALISDYVVREKRRGKKPKAVSTIQSIIKSGGMTWVSFVFLLFEILKVDKVRIVVEVEKDGKTYRAEIDEFRSAKTLGIKKEENEKENNNEALEPDKE